MDSEKGILLIKYLEWWNVAVRLDLPWSAGNDKNHFLFFSFQSVYRFSTHI